MVTTLEQSKKLVKLGINITTADMYYFFDYNIEEYEEDAQIIPQSELGQHFSLFPEDIPAWSLTALLKFLGKIKPQVYTPILFLSEGKWTLQFVEYGHGNVCEVSCNNPVDACYEMILKLNELKML